MKILLAEDDLNISKVTKMTLEYIGKHTVTVVENGRLALDEALKNSYDLLLLDNMMPEMDGITTCIELKKQNYETPIIFLSAKSQEADIRQSLKQGAIGYIQKPFEPNEICDRIAEILKEHEERAA